MKAETDDDGARHVEDTDALSDAVGEDVPTLTITGVEIAPDRLQAIVDRIENCEAEIANWQSDRKEIYAEAKGAGFDTAIIRKIIKLRKMDTVDRVEQETLLKVYGDALGMQLGLPL